MAVELFRLDQARDRGRAWQANCVPAKNYLRRPRRPDSDFLLIVMMLDCLGSASALLNASGCSRWHYCGATFHNFLRRAVQRRCDLPGKALTLFKPLPWRPVFHLALNGVQLANELDHRRSNGAFCCRPRHCSASQCERLSVCSHARRAMVVTTLAGANPPLPMPCTSATLEILLRSAWPPFARLAFRADLSSL